MRDAERGTGLATVGEVLGAWQASYNADVAARKEWWEKREIAGGAAEKGWRWVLKLLPPNITRDEIASIEPSLDWAEERLVQCRTCSRTAGGGCDVGYYMRAGEGTRPFWNGSTRSMEFIRCHLDVEHQLRKRLAYFGVPAGLLGATFENFTANDSLRDEIKLYVDKFQQAGPTGYYFVGGVGTGKSHLAAAVVRELTKRGALRSALFAFVPWFFDELRSNFDRPVEQRDEFMQHVLGCDLLVLDDLGSERTTEWVREQLGIIIHMRWANQKPVLVTSNLMLTEYRGVLGERAYSRLSALVPYARVIAGGDRR